MSDRTNQKTFDDLLAGVRRFRREIYPEQRELYQRVASQKQQPHTLVITCADSRIDPELLTQSGPGDIFVTRNIGNLVPAYGQMIGGVSAVIEYAVSALEVSQVVICGHSDCGAMKGLLHPESLASLPVVSSWLRNAESALRVVEARKSYDNESETLAELIRENVLLQLNHLRTHPSVAGRMAQGKLTVHGWVYEIGHGSISMHDVATNKFHLIGEES